MNDLNRTELLNNAKYLLKGLEKELKRYSSEKLTTEEYTSVVEIREACNRIIEDEMCRGWFMIKVPTTKDIECFNELNRLNIISREGDTPKWYVRKRKDEIFEKSDYVSPVDFWSDYLEWSKKAVQLKLFREVLWKRF